MKHWLQGDFVIERPSIDFRCLVSRVKRSLARNQVRDCSAGHRLVYQSVFLSVPVPSRSPSLFVLRKRQ